MKLLSVSADAKTVKGEKKGYLTGILYLAPADTSGVERGVVESSVARGGAALRFSRAQRETKFSGAVTTCSPVRFCGG